MCEILGIIPAKGDSKRVPHKNIAMVAGKPMIAYPILAALQSKYINRLIVATDSEEAAQIAKEYGAEVPFLRPPELSKETATVTEVLVYTLNWLEENEGYKPDYFVVLQATSPLGITEDIDGAIEFGLEKNVTTVLSVCPVEHRTSSMILLADRQGHIVETMTRRVVGEAIPMYMQNGVARFIKTQPYRKTPTFYFPDTLVYEMPLERSLDVDTPWHLHVADLVLRDASK